MEWAFTCYRPVEEQQRLARLPVVQREIKVDPALLHESRIKQHRTLIFEGASIRYDERGPVNLLGIDKYSDSEGLT